MEEHFLADTALFGQLGAAFGLTQTALGQLLGLSSKMISQVATGRRRLPPATYVALTHLVVALQAAPPLPDPLADPPPVPPLDPADLAALGRHARACRATAARLVVEQAALATRAAWATRRLAVLPVLTATVPALGPAPQSPDTGHVPAPRWLARFAEEAREALAASGPLAQARLALRRAALLHEATLTDRLLAGEALTAVVPPGLGEP